MFRSISEPTRGQRHSVNSCGIDRAGSRDDITAHFIGSIVYVAEGLSQVSQQAPLLVIDGQQRLTTVLLLIKALAQALGDDEPVDGFSAPKLNEYYLTNHLEKGDRYFKILLSQTDNSSFQAIIRDTHQPSEPSLCVTQNFALFNKLLRDTSKSDLATVCRGLDKLVLVDITLDQHKDNAQQIFESMNSTGKELSQADLIRNFVLMGLEQESQTNLYNDYWRPMEKDFGQEAYGTQFNSFMRHYLTVRTGTIPREHEVYKAFKDYSSEQGQGEALVKDIHTFAGYFCALALGAEQDATLRRVFQDLRELKAGVAYPLLLRLYADYANNKLSAADLVAAVRLVESYVFRRAICNIPTNSMNTTFASFGKSLQENRYLESLQEHFCSLPSYRRFPRDEEFLCELQQRNLYHFRHKSYWLRRFESHDRKESVPDEYTSEHILPQNPDLSPAWKLALGDDWQRIQLKYLHTLGNLTLTGYNAEYKDRPFTDKRDMSGGFKESPLKLNEMLRGLEKWDENAIQKRAKVLADQALIVWGSPPKLNDSTPASQPKPVPSPSDYCIDDHRFLCRPGVVREVFDAFSKEVLALDPCVSEEFRKDYVAYKAETNFVDAVPLAKRLRLSFNMPFTEMRDPKKLCRDVTHVGGWGNGDVEIGLQSLDELPYVMSLVRQSFDHQMGDGG